MVVSTPVSTWSWPLAAKPFAWPSLAKATVRTPLSSESTEAAASSIQATRRSLFTASSTLGQR
jgi:hypothetical protein